MRLGISLPPASKSTSSARGLPCQLMASVVGILDIVSMYDV